VTVERNLKTDGLQRVMQKAVMSDWALSHVAVTVGTRDSNTDTVTASAE